MRILVGVLYSGENEFAECLAALQRQSYRDFEYFIVTGLPKREAHDRLYGIFMARAKEFDIFVKVDADMVIEDRDLFAKLVDRFWQNPNMDQLTIAVHDFFTDRLIEGMHAYRSSVRWPKRDSDVFTDRHPVPRDRQVIDYDDLAPAAIHCKNPSPFQAFHFGLHRALKILTYLQLSRGQPSNLQFHLNNNELVWHHFLRTGDVRLGFAALGAELALRGDFNVAHISYTNPYAQGIFQRRYAHWGAVRIKWVVRWLRFRNRACIPALRRSYQLGLRVRRVIRWFVPRPIRMVVKSALKRYLALWGV